MLFSYYRKRNKRLKTVVSMLPCGAPERSNNPYIESIVGPCFSNNQKEIFTVWFWFWRKSWKRLRQWKKASMSRKRNLCTYVLEKKRNSFEISVIILRYLRNVNLSYSREILKLQKFFKKTYFFLYFTGRPKNGKGNKQRRRREYMHKSN